jgi:hypothetical protein
MAELSWIEICEKANENNKTIICEVPKKHSRRFFKVNCNICGEEKEARATAFKGCKKCCYANNRSHKEEFIEKARTVHGDKYNYDLVDYINSTIKVKIFCNHCQDIFEQRPQGHLSGKGCNTCSVISLTSNTEEFISKAKSVHGNKFNYHLVEYINSYTKIKIFCNTCKNIFEEEPSLHLYKPDCVLCNKNKRLNKEKFLLKSVEIHGDKYNYDLVDYVSVGKKVQIKCNSCERTFLQRPFDHLRGRGCKICFLKNRTRSSDEFVSIAKSVHGNKYNYDLVDYTNQDTKVDIYCNKCKKTFSQRPFQHLKGGGCKTCADDRLRDDVESFISKSKAIHGNKYNYDLVEYTSSLIKVRIICNRCTEIFDQRPADHLRGVGCSICRESRGEIKIAEYLNGINISFIRQKSFDGLRNKNPLKYDFYLPDHNKIIEFDGEGHYMAIFGSSLEGKQKNLEAVQINDEIKNKYALKNNIPLLRIPYWDFDKIEELIEAFILENARQKELNQSSLEI